MKKCKCPLCGKEMEWLGEKKVKKLKERYLVWCCNITDDTHWFGGNVFTSDLNFKVLSPQEDDELNEKIREEEFELWD